MNDVSGSEGQMGFRGLVRPANVVVLGVAVSGLTGCGGGGESPNAFAGINDVDDRSHHDGQVEHRDDDSTDVVDDDRQHAAGATGGRNREGVQRGGGGAHGVP